MTTTMMLNRYLPQGQQQRDDVSKLESLSMGEIPIRFWKNGDSGCASRRVAPRIPVVRCLLSSNVLIFMVLFVATSATTTTTMTTTTAFGLRNRCHYRTIGSCRLNSSPCTPKFGIATKRAVLFSSTTTTTTTTLQGVLLLDPPSHNEMEHQKNRNKNDWTAVPGGYVPHIAMNSREDGSMASFPRETSANDAAAAATAATTSSSTTTVGNRRTASTLIPVVTTLSDYKRVVVDEPSRLTVVRFAAPWCRACQAVQPHYVHLARLYAQNERQEALDSNETTLPSPMLVQFVECPVRKDTAVLHQGLGVPSVPFGHIYHPDVGLVEEVKLNKKSFATFKRLLETYVQGYCLVSYTTDERGRCRAGPAAAPETTLDSSIAGR
jgi:thiol-disulfide isomerase/thioredoxin